MTPLSLLKQIKNEHEEVKKLFKKNVKLNKSESPEVLQEIQENPAPFERGEQKTLFSRLKGFWGSNNN